MPRVYVMPLFGAYVADTRWGRYKTVCVAVGITLIGHVLLIVSAVPGVIEKPNNSLACFVIALIVMGMGTGSFKATISPLVAEQYKKTKLFIGHTRSGERVVVDPILTTSRIYMYFYLLINVGSLIGQISMVYSEKVCYRFVSSYLVAVSNWTICSMSASTCHSLSPPSSSSSARLSFTSAATCTPVLPRPGPSLPQPSVSGARR